MNRRIARRSALGLCAALVLGLGVAPAQAQTDGEGWAYQLAHELMSPFCPGRTLSACTSPQAAELRQWIVLQEASGATREEVIANLSSRFGDVIQSEPKAEGWGLAAWLLPIAALVIGAGLVALVLVRMTRPGDDSGAQAAPASLATAGPSDAELERLVDEELRAGDI